MSWPMISIGDFCITGSGGTPSRKNPEFYDGDIPWVKSDDLREGLITSVSEHISELAIQKSSAKIVPKGALLLAMYGATVGRMAELGIDAATNQAVCNITPDPEKADSKYVYYALLNKVPEFLRNAVGGAQPNISQGMIKNTKIALPSLPEQKRIAAILDKAHAIRRKRQQAIELANEFLRSVFLDMFGDPVVNPKGWKVVGIDKVCSDIVDCVNRTAKTVDYETPYKMIRTTNVRNYKVDLENVRYVAEDVYTKWTRRLTPQKGDIIFTREAPAGEAGIIESDDLAFLGQRTMHFRPDLSVIDSSFLLHELMGASIKDQIRRLSSGSTVVHLSVPECKKFQVRTPPLELQKRFGEIRKRILSTLTKYDAAATDQEQAFNSLSQKAFSGNL